MKKIMLYGLVLLTCGCSEGPRLQDFIPGVYTGEWSNAFSQSRDTIVIEPAVTGGSESYLIMRRTGIVYRDAAREPQHLVTTWTGLYRAEQKIVEVMPNGRILSFDPAHAVMTMGVVVYRKQ